MSKTWKALVVLFALGAVLVACGDDDDSSSASANTDATVGSKAAAALVGKGCAQAASAYASAVASAGQIFTGKSADVDKSIAALRAFVAKAPDEIKDDLQVVATVYADFVKAYAKVGYDATSGKPPTSEQADALEELSTKLDNSKVKAAGEHVSAWFDENCKKNG